MATHGTNAVCVGMVVAILPFSLDAFSRAGESRVQNEYPLYKSDDTRFVPLAIVGSDAGTARSGRLHSPSIPNTPRMR